MEFTWNQKLYNEIVTHTECLGKRSIKNNVIDVTSAKYKAMVTEIEEEYLTHPDGPYKGTKEEMKRDKNYLTKKLIQNYRKVL